MTNNEERGRIYREWKKLHLKCEREKRHREFLKDCKYFNITPNFMKIRNKFLNREHGKEINIFYKSVLNKIIKKKYATIARLENETRRRERDAEKQYSQEELQANREKIQKIEQRERAAHIERQNKKLKYWMKRKGVEHFRERETYPYINTSNLILNTHQDTLLKKGAKYIMEDRIQLRDSIPKIENLLEKIPEPDRTKWRGEIQTEMERKMRETERDSEDRRELAKLKKNRDIAILETDKTGKIIIMNREEYDRKMKETIEKLNTEIIETDPNRKLTEKVKRLIKEGEWPEQYKKPINKGTATNTPRIFGKYKDHKSPPTIRPIVNKREGATYQMEKYMKQIYQEIMPESENVLQSTENFINWIRTAEMEEDEIMVSFDVKDLYPSINTNEITEIIQKKLENKYGKNTKIAQTLINATNLIINNSFFTFKGKFYRQKTGVPMGSPISGPIAEHKMRELEETILKIHGQKIRCWKRYVDDIFAIIKKDNEAEEILEELNKTDKNIKFTLEKENNGEINFLDVRIMKKGSAIETTVYKKPGKLNQILEAQSKTTREYKHAAIRAYIDRALKICSNKNLLDEELEKIKNIGYRAGYEIKTVEKIIGERKRKLDEITQGQRQRKIFTEAINYDRGIGVKIKNKGREYGLTIPIRQNKTTFQRIRNEKDEIEEGETSGIYKIPIIKENNEKEYYIGLTKRKIKERMNEHKNDLRLGKTGTALAQKNNIENIAVEFEKVEKLANYNNLNYALKREAVEIIRENKSINLTQHAFLDKRWRHLIKGKDGEKGKTRESAPTTQSSSQERKQDRTD